MPCHRTIVVAGMLSAAVCASRMAGQAGAAPAPQREVFVVGRETAIGNPLEGFRPTRVELPDERMDGTAKRQLERMMLSEMGFAHRPLPLGAPGLTLHANGRLTAEAKDLQKQLYEKGMCADRGDRIMVTDLAVQRDRIVIDINGGPYLKHRFLRHVQVNNTPLAGNGMVGEQATGTRITLLFEEETPRITAAELKSLLAPLLDFGNKTSQQAYADSLPEAVKKAVQEHELLVGMNKRMVLAALGPPESKIRERPSESSNGEVLEEWIYGRSPQTVRFVRFRGDRVILLKTAALGSAVSVRDKNEVGEYHDPSRIRTIALGDARPDTPESKNADGENSEGPERKAPSLRSEEEMKSATGQGKPAGPQR